MAQRVSTQVTLTMDWEQFEHLYALANLARMGNGYMYQTGADAFQHDGQVVGVNTTAKGMQRTFRDIRDTYEDGRRKGLDRPAQTYTVGSAW